MSNTPTSNNSDLNRSTPIVNHDNQQTNNSDETVGLADQTNNLNLDSSMEDASPWIPDNQDGIEFIHSSLVGPNTKPEIVIKYLCQQLIRCTSLITLATIRNNLEEVQGLNEQRKDLQQRLAIMEDVLINEQSRYQDAPTKSNYKSPVVPKDLPAFQLRGQHRHDKRRDSYDSAESFLDDFEVHLAAYELDVEENWRRLIPMTCDANRRAWLLSTMKKKEITNWTLFRAEVERYFTSPYTIFYRRHRIRTMKQSKNQSLRKYSNKLQEYAVKYGIPNNQDLVFNYLCSLNRQYRKKAWTLIANHHGDQIPDKLEPVVQMVQSLAASETSSDNSSTSDSNSDSDEETDSDGEKPHNKRRRTNNKSKGKGKAPPIPKKNACFLHPKSKHTRFDCEKLKKVLRVSRNNNNWQTTTKNLALAPSLAPPTEHTTRMALVPVTPTCVVFVAVFHMCEDTSARKCFELAVRT